MNIDSKELRTTLTDVKDRVLILAGQSKASRVKEVLAAEVRMLETMLMFIHKAEKEGVLDMEKLDLVLSEEMISLDSIPTRRRSSQLEEKILAVVERLKPNGALPMDPEKIKYSYFEGKVRMMKKEKKIPPNIVSVKRGDKFYLGMEKSSK